MKYIPFALLLSVLLTTATTIADESKTGDQDTLKHVNVGKLLQDADQAGTLPDGVVVRVKANMALADTGKEQIQFQECWEFTATEIHRVVTEEEDNEVIFRREKSRPFDSARLCHDLAQGRVLEIHANKGPGERVHFALTDFHLGERSIEILVNGKSVLMLHESCLFAGYREHHARAFATLYERLASQARAVFEGFWARDMLLSASKAETWPNAMVVRLGADVYSRDGEPSMLKEDWEFSDGKVHRIVSEKPAESQRVVYRREESRDFDTNRICRDLIDGRAFEIGSDASIENSLLLAGYKNALGGRYIEVLVDTKHALDLHEHCTGAGYSETHARAFAKLYETLASQARIAFAKSEVRSPLQ